MQTHSSNTLLSQIDQRRDNIADVARTYLKNLKEQFPEVQYLTLNLKHLYGFSSLRVYTKKEDQQQATNNDNMNDPLASPF
jgi:hypothetical protein